MSRTATTTETYSIQEDVHNLPTDVIGFANDDQKLWWHSTAPMFAKMLQMANYDIRSQCRHMDVYKKHIIPFLGVYPTTERDNRWLSILTRYGTPFELSLNCSDSVVRYTYEPINAATGTAEDPFNTHAIWESLQGLAAIQPGVDLEWFRHFKNDLTVNATDSAFLAQKNLAGGQIKTQNKLALDLKGEKFVLKTYIYPELKAVATGKTVQELMFDSVRTLSKEHESIRPAFSMLEDYAQSRSGPESTLVARLLSCDLIDPTKSRIKIYLSERMVSLSAMEDLWTLGGRRSDSSTTAGFEMIQELWDLLQIPPGLRSYPEPYLALGTIPDEQLPTMVNYTLHHNDPMPEPQVYFTVFGMNDMAVADALTTFFERHGWTDMARKYKDSLQSY
jgi:tryptophan dimethylallyltransferase